MCTIIIPGSVTEISSMAFWDCYNLTIVAPKTSYAEKFAKEDYYIKFKRLK